MNATKTRYPGAQPFSDDAISRRLFFGRDRVARLLTDQILAKRMIVLYAKSGLGKTSLLNAAVAPQLRDEGHLPLIVRVNEVEKGPRQSILDGICAEAARQHVEYVPGNTDSLWNFFSTSEFWRGDLLLVPVLILDQFEEIFTLQSEEQRNQFLTELSYLVRGVPPPSFPPDSAGTDFPTADLSRSPPLMHIVLSLREDYLGFLEEAADQIPQILDARFRLAPLDLQAAEDAITKPASLDDPTLTTRPFAFDQDAVKLILDCLSKRRMKSSIQSAPHVEPFQLQLICRRLEQLVEPRQHESRSPVTITTNDVGGETAITKTLKDFYIDTISDLPRRRERRAAKRLCEDYLISPEGRRLSLEENQIHLQLNLRQDSLRTLVASRLLRCENRSDNVYYELSHDSLIAPILSSKRIKTFFTGWAGFSAGLVFFLFFSILLMLIFLAGAVDPPWNEESGPERFATIFLFIILIIGSLCLSVVSAFFTRNNARTLARYWSIGAAAEISGAPMAGSLSAWTSLIVGSIVLLMALLVGSVLAALLFSDPEAWPPWLEEGFGEYKSSIRENRMGLDLFAYIMGMVGLVVFAFRCIHWGITRFARYPISQMNRFKDNIKGCRRGILILYASFRISFSLLFILSSAVIVVVTFIIIDCLYVRSLHFPSWIFSDVFTFVAADCLDKEDSLFDIFGTILLAVVLVWLARQMLKEVIVIAEHLFPASRDRLVRAPATH